MMGQKNGRNSIKDNSIMKNIDWRNKYITIINLNLNMILKKRYGQILNQLWHKLHLDIERAAFRQIIGFVLWLWSLLGALLGLKLGSRVGKQLWSRSNTWKSLCVPIHIRTWGLTCNCTRNSISKITWFIPWYRTYIQTKNRAKDKSWKGTYILMQNRIYNRICYNT